MPIRDLIAESTAADCTHACHLLSGLTTEYLLADRAYDTNTIREYPAVHGIQPVIPSKKNRRKPQEHNAYLYRARHLIENAFLHLNRWRGITTRYLKNEFIVSRRSHALLSSLA